MTTKIPVELSSTPGISDSSDATAITIDSSENVGIGTSSPSKRFHVYNTAAADVGLLESTQAYSTLSFKSSTNSSTVTVGIDGAGNASLENKLSSGHMTFVTNGSERARILSDGKVGIGKTDPNYQLVVAGTNPKIQIYDSAGSGQTNLYFGDSGSNLAGYVIYQHSDNKMRLGTNATDRITIDSTGRVNIGATASSGLAGTIFPQGYRGRQGVGVTEKNTFNLAFQASGATQLWIDYSSYAPERRTGCSDC